MFHVALPEKIGAGPNAGKPNLIAITSAKLTTTDTENKKVSLKFGTDSYVDSAGVTQIGIPAGQFQYPQFGPEPAKDDKSNYIELTDEQAQAAVDEAIKDAGGIVRFVENYNDATRTAALNKGKNYIRTKESGDPAAIVAEGLKLTQNFSWAAAERVTNASVKAAVSELADNLDNLSLEEIKARLKASLGRS